MIILNTNNTLHRVKSLNYKGEYCIYLRVKLEHSEEVIWFDEYFQRLSIQRSEELEKGFKGAPQENTDQLLQRLIEEAKEIAKTSKLNAVHYFRGRSPIPMGILEIKKLLGL